MSKQITVGQKVKCIDASGNAGGRLKEGDIYTVREVLAGFVYVFAEAKQGRDGWSYTRFEPVAEQHEFKVGDTVRIAKKVTLCADGFPGLWVSSMDAYLGRTGTVTRVHGAGEAYRVRTDDQEWNYDAESLELVESAPEVAAQPEPIDAEPRKPQTGDVVRPSHSTLDITVGKAYTVTRVNEFGDVYVKDDAGDENGLLSAVEWELVRAVEDAPVGDFRIRKHGARGEIRGTSYASLEDAEKAVARYMPGTAYEIGEFVVRRVVKVEQEVRVVDYKEAA